MRLCAKVALVLPKIASLMPSHARNDGGTGMGHQNDIPLKQAHTKAGLLTSGLVCLTALGACGRVDNATSSEQAADGVAGSTETTIVDGAVALITGWALSVQVPGADIPVLVRTHAGRCIEAGPAICRVETAQASAVQSQASGTLRVLADPQWLVGFRQGVEGDVKGMGGKTEAESLSMDNVSGQVRAARDALADAAPRTDQRTQARRDLADLDDRVKMHTMEVSYQPLPGLLSGAGGGAILAVLATAGTLSGYGVAILLALALLLGPALLGWFGWRWIKHRAAASVMPHAQGQTPTSTPA
jgi:hypothetical protein